MDSDKQVVDIKAAVMTDVFSVCACVDRMSQRLDKGFTSGELTSEQYVQLTDGLINALLASVIPIEVEVVNKVEELWIPGKSADV